MMRRLFSTQSLAKEEAVRTVVEAESACRRASGEQAFFGKDLSHDTCLIGGSILLLFVILPWKLSKYLFPKPHVFSAT